MTPNSHITDNLVLHLLWSGCNCGVRDAFFGFALFIKFAIGSIFTRESQTCSNCRSSFFALTPFSLRTISIILTSILFNPCGAALTIFCSVNRRICRISYTPAFIWLQTGLDSLPLCIIIGAVVSWNALVAIFSLPTNVTLAEGLQLCLLITTLQR